MYHKEVTLDVMRFVGMGGRGKVQRECETR